MEARFIVLLPDNPGKILSATPLIRGLKKQVEESYIYVMVRSSFAWLIRGNPYVDEILTWQGKPDEQIANVRDLLPDYFLNLDELKTYRRLQQKTRVLEFKVPKARKTETAIYADRIFKTVYLFDVEDDKQGVDFIYPPFNPDWLPEKFLGGYVVLSLEAPFSGQRLTDDRLVELVSLIEKPLVVTGPAGERELAERIGQRTGCTVFPACGDFPDPETASLISASKAVIAYDSQWPGIVRSMGKPVLTLGDPGSGNLAESAVWIRKWFD
ncbi:MAG: hypothetical protein V2A67_08550 [Bacteroidota bacterium]